MASKPVAYRCAWAQSEHAIAYHDAEWGVPSHDDRHLFEMLLLEGAQAGLSWETILRKREGYRRAFDSFDAATVARYTPARVERLMQDADIVRNRAKIESAILNAKAVLAIQREHRSFDAYIWQFNGGAPIVNRRRSIAEVPASTPESDEMAKALKALGMKFVGTTICYAFMQATGMVDDHETRCFRHTSRRG
jgi:DNA-3-methyladenine glycosylase I